MRHAEDFPEELLTYIRNRYHYSPETGLIWFRCKQKSKLVCAYKRHKETNYLSIDISLGKKRYRFYAHRLAWFLHYGVLPANVIDHIDTNPENNKLENIRDVPQSLNARRTHIVICRHCGNNIHDDLK